MTSSPLSEPGLDEGQFRRLAAYGVAHEVAVGEALYATGDASYDLILLESASVEIVRDATASEAEHVVMRRSPGSNVLALEGGDRLMSVVVGGPDSREQLECRGVFCFVGADPATEWLTGVELDEDGFVLTDVRLGVAAGADRLPFQTNLPGVFAAGDVRAGSMKRVAAAVGEGASAVASVHVVLGRQVEGPRPQDGAGSTQNSLPDGSV